MTAQEFFEKTNWEILHKQKTTLIDVMKNPDLSADELWLLEGLLQFLDTAGDVAEEMNLFKYVSNGE